MMPESDSQSAAVTTAGAAWPAAEAAARPRFSVVIPVLNEAENVLPLLDELTASLGDAGDYEIVFVDDGSTDDTAARLQAAMPGHPGLRLLRHGRRHGQSAALRTGVAAAHGTWIVTLDGDGQNDPADIRTLLDIAWQREGQREGQAEGPCLALVAGLRLKRRDSAARRLATRIANAVRQAALRDGCPDSGCSLKVFRRDAYLGLPYFGAMHRFLPALFLIHGHQVTYRPVNHRPRLRGTTKYKNFRRGLVGVVDLLGVIWLKRRTDLPPQASER
jgi:dolichol-phosphate mannosyltransferase